MHRYTNCLLALVLLAASSLATAQGGNGYEVLKTPQPTETPSGVVEVREFFSYACPHCYTFRPLMDKYLQSAEQVQLVRTAVVFREDWRPLAQAYYAAEQLGALDTIHEPLFAAIHAKNQKFEGRDDLVDFFASQGIPREKAAAAFDSFVVDMKLRKGTQQLRDYRIDSTPTVIVNGKYRVSPRTAGGQAGMIRVIDGLVRQELAANSK